MPTSADAIGEDGLVFTFEQSRCRISGAETLRLFQSLSRFRCHFTIGGLLMKARLLLALVFVFVGTVAYGQNEKAARSKAFPVSLSADDVREFAPLNVQLNELTLTSLGIAGIPMTCEPGITGVMLIGDGKFRFSPKDGEVIEGQFRAAMLRFNPNEQEQILPLAKIEPVTDHAVHEMSSLLMRQTMRRCWHSGADALIPEEGTLSVVVYSREHGELLISTGKASTIVYNFTTKKSLYESKGR